MGKKGERKRVNEWREGEKIRRKEVKNCGVEAKTHGDKKPLKVENVSLRPPTFVGEVCRAWIRRRDGCKQAAERYSMGVCIKGLIRYFWEVEAGKTVLQEGDGDCLRMEGVVREFNGKVCRD